MRALLFDALGTLLRLRDPAPRCRTLLADRHGLVLEEAVVRRGFALEIAHYRANMIRAGSAEGLAVVRAECAEVLREALGLRLDDGAMLALLLDSLRFEAFPDAVPALRWAAARGLRTVCASNWDVSLHEVLDRTGLSEELDGAVSSAEAGAAKPDPAVFERALAIAGCSAEEAVHVGDSPREDGEGAAAAGLRFVLVRTPGGLASLAELPAALSGGL